MDKHQITIEGTTFIVTPDNITVKKNGLTINVAHEVFDQFLVYVCNIAYSGAEDIFNEFGMTGKG